MNKVTDSAGNYFEIFYTEAATGGEYRPLRIKYTGNDDAGVLPYAQVTFNYEPRPDPSLGFVADSRVATGMRMTSIVTQVAGTIAREYNLYYQATETFGQTLSRLAHIQVCANEGEAGTVMMRCLPATDLDWQSYPSGFGGVSASRPRAERDVEHTMDVDGDGLDDIVYREGPSSSWKILFATGSGFRLVNSGKVTGGGEQAVFDYDGDGRQDLAILSGDFDCTPTFGNPCATSYPLRVLKSTGETFALINTNIDYADYEGVDLLDGGVAADVNGDGHTDLVIAEGVRLPFNNVSYRAVVLLNSGGSFTRITTSPLVNPNDARVFEYDGDGRAELMLSSGDSNRVLRWTGADLQNLDSGLGETLLKLADLNGDGLQDAVVDNDGKVGIRLSQGGLFGPLSPTSYDTTNVHLAQVIDYNSDGRQDLFVPLEDDWRAMLAWRNGMNFDRTSTDIPIVGFDDRPQIGEFNGDGLLDIAIAKDGVWNLRFHKPGVPGLMTSINSGGARFSDLITVSYLPLTNTAYAPFGDATPFYTRGPALQCDGTADCNTRGIIAPMYVTASYRKNNGVFTSEGTQGSRLYSYAYEDARVDISGRGFLGFAKQTVKDNATSIYTANSYARDFPRTGMIESTETRLIDATRNRLLSLVTNRYQSISTTTNDIPMFPYLKSSVNQQYDLDGAELIATTSTDNLSDMDGNLTDITVSVADDTGAHTTHTVNQYLPTNLAAWRLGRLSRSTVTQTGTTGSITRVATFGYDQATGILNQEIVEPDFPTLRLQTDYQLNRFGQVAVETVSGSGLAEPRITKTFYTSNGRFPLSVENAEDDSETYGYDYLNGGVQTLRGPNNLPTGWTYDGLGRQQLETRADGTTTEIGYGWCDATVCAGAAGRAVYRRVTITRGLSGAKSAPTTTEYFDSLNRVIVNETDGFDGTAVLVETAYTGRGEVQRVSRPYKEGAFIKYWTSYLYDDLSRVTRENSATTGLADIVYDGLTTTTTRTVRQSDGATTLQVATETKDARGLTVAALSPGQLVATKYEYDPAGNLEVVEDSVGNRTVNVYDRRGHKIQTTDPDMGLWTYDYNALGELIKQTDAKGQVSAFKYDPLGRMVERTEPEGTTKLITTWAYDTAAKGVSKLASETSRLASKTSAEFKRTYTYDQFSRPEKTTTTIGGTSYTSELDYDRASRVEVIHYPNNFAVRNVYNAHGYLERVKNADNDSLTYWTAVAVNADGQVTQEYRDEGGSVSGSITVNRGYDPATGRIDKIQTGPNNSIQNLDYTFDSLGNLERRQDSVQGLDETFQYDDLNRVTEVATTIDSIALPRKTIAYNSLGNITHKDGVGIYTYAPARPHAVTSAGGNTYSYDANGSMLTSAGRTLTWNGANLPATINQGSNTLTFSYGPDRSRYKQVAVVNGTTATTHYVGGLYEKIVTGSLTTQRYYIQAGQEAIAVQIKRNSGDREDLRYLFRDHLGSVDTITDRGGVVKERLSYDAWGKRRMLKPTDPITSMVLPYGFTNHEHLDSVGLIHMNGRVYDPSLSRFVSADPFVQFPKDSQSLNRYSYVLNNPLSLVDPNGLFLDGVFDFFGDIVEYVVDNPQVIIGIAVGIFTGVTVFNAVGGGLLGAIVGGGVGGFYGGLFSTGDLEAAVVGGVTGAAFGFLGAYAPVANANLAFRSFVHGLVGGTSAELQGRDFKEGFVSAGVAEGLSPIIGDDVPGFGGGAQRVIAAAVVGGTAAELSGGKFGNGAATGAFARLFTDEVAGPPEQPQPGPNARATFELRGKRVLPFLGPLSPIHAFVVIIDHVSGVAYEFHGDASQSILLDGTFGEVVGRPGSREQTAFVSRRTVLLTVNESADVFLRQLETYRVEINQASNAYNPITSNSNSYAYGAVDVIELLSRPSTQGFAPAAQTELATQ